MNEIIPSILEKDFSEIENKVRIISEVSPWVQIDVVDGVFAPNKTWPFIHTNDEDLKKFVQEEESLPEWESVSYEFDLMVSNPRAVADTFVMVGASRIIVHYSSFKDDHEREVFLKEFKNKYTLHGPLSVELGLAVRTDVPVTEISKYIDTVDFVQVMGIEHVGFQGQQFDEKTFEYIGELRKQFPDLVISIDGGVKEEYMQKLVEVGANRICIGSAIWSSENPPAEFEHLKDLLS